jgi:hypothetical protein
MVYNTQNYWVFGLFPSSGIIETRKHDVSFSIPVPRMSSLSKFVLYIFLSPAELAWPYVIK